MLRLSTKNLKNLTSTTNRFYSVKRKYPIDLSKANELPIFEYGTSKKSYRRVFVYGNIETGALGVPYLHKKDPYRFKEVRYPKRLTFAEKHSITHVACGFGFSAFAVDDDDSTVKLYGTGLNTDSQIGYHAIRAGHPLQVIYFPQPIALPFKNGAKTKIRQIAAGRAHLAALSDDALFLLGNNSYGQCAREIIPDENYFHSNYINSLERIDDKPISSVECGQDHTLAITQDGSVYSCGWGADGQTGQGHFANSSQFAKCQGDITGEKIVKLSSRSDFVLALNDKGQVFGWGNAEYDQIKADQQQVCHPTHLTHLEELGRIVDIATGGSFCLVLNESGQVFVWGFGILGAGPKTQQSATPIELKPTLFGRSDFQPNSKVVKIQCGLSYAVALTNLGDLYAWGRNTNYCLGLGDGNDQYFPLKVSLGGYAQEVSCGIDHTIVVCKPFI